MLSTLSQSIKTPMLISRLKQMQKKFNQFYFEISDKYRQGSRIDKEEAVTIFFINNLFYLITKLDNFEELTESEDADGFEKTFHNKVENYLNVLFVKYFEDMSKIIRLCSLRVDAEMSVRNTTRNANNSVFDSADAQINLEEVQKLPLEYLEKVYDLFNGEYKARIRDIYKDISKSIKNSDNAKMIFRQFLKECAIRYYTFDDILKAAKSSKGGNVFGNKQQIMMEIVNFEKTLI